MPMLESSPPSLDAYLPSRPANLANLPGPKRKMMKNLVEKAVAQKMMMKPEDELAMSLDSKVQDRTNLLPYFQDRYVIWSGRQ